jgi:hypothetical protein
MVMWYEEADVGRIRRSKKFVKKDRAIAWAKRLLVTLYPNEAEKIRLAKELSRGAATQLYLIRCGEYVKIGSSSDSDSRLRQLQSRRSMVYKVQKVFDYMSSKYR